MVESVFFFVFFKDPVDVLRVYSQIEIPVLDNLTWKNLGKFDFSLEILLKKMVIFQRNFFLKN